MTTLPYDKTNRSNANASSGHCLFTTALLTLASVLLAGCQTATTQPPKAAEQPTSQPQAVILREGDVVRVTFPGTPSLDAQSQPQQVLRDGTIAVPLLVGGIKAAGLTPGELEKELARRYKSELVSNEVKVTVVSSAYVVYVNGAVLRPGKVTSDHPITALEAIMEAGGFDYTKANPKAVRVIRNEGNATKNYTLNLKSVLKGGTPEPFYLKPSDTVYVPERFSWF